MPATNLISVKRLVTLLAGLTLFLPVMHWEVSLVNDLNAELSSTETVSAPDIHVDVPKALDPLIRALDR